MAKQIFVKECNPLVMSIVERTKLRDCHKNCDSQDISDEIQSFVTKKYFSNVVQNFSGARTLSDQNYSL